MAALSGSGAIGSLPIGAAAIGGEVGPQDQNLSASRFDGASAFYSAAVGLGAVTLSPARVDVASSFFAPAVARGAVTLAPARLNGAASFYPPSASVGGGALLPSLVEGANAFFGPAVARGAVTLSPTRVEGASSVFSATVTRGAATLAPALLENAQDFPAATVSAASRAAGGYGPARKYYVRVGDRLLAFATAEEAAQTLGQREDAAPAEDAPQARQEAAGDDDLAEVVQPPAPVEIVPLASILQYARAMAAQEQVRALLRQREYEALARVYESWRDEEDVELLMTVI